MLHPIERHFVENIYHILDLIYVIEKDVCSVTAREGKKTLSDQLFERTANEWKPT